MGQRKYRYKQAFDISTYARSLTGRASSCFVCTVICSPFRHEVFMCRAGYSWVLCGAFRTSRKTCWLPSAPVQSNVYSTPTTYIDNYSGMTDYSSFCPITREDCDVKEKLAGDAPKTTRLDVAFPLVVAARNSVEYCGRAIRWSFFVCVCTPCARLHPGGAIPSI